MAPLVSFFVKCRSVLGVGTILVLNVLLRAALPQQSRAVLVAKCRIVVVLRAHFLKVQNCHRFCHDFVP